MLIYFYLVRYILLNQGQILDRPHILSVGVIDLTKIYFDLSLMSEFGFDKCQSPGVELSYNNKRKGSHNDSTK
jgi:hypothetical protein